MPFSPIPVTGKTPQHLRFIMVRTQSRTWSEKVDIGSVFSLSLRVHTSDERFIFSLQNECVQTNVTEL